MGEDMDDVFEKILPIIGKIKEEHKDENWTGIEVCPVCGGKLFVGIASCNNHTRGKCEKEKCVMWME